MLDDLKFNSLLEPLQELKSCSICPRNCGADRFSDKLGYCKSDSSFSISSICIHKGEEPPISGNKGICNVFFTNCNLQCLYCQNYQISNNKQNRFNEKLSLKQVITKIINILDTGINSVGFVSPSHNIPQIKIIINTLKTLGLNPTIVFNSNAYDKVEVLKDMENLIDVYLPDFKYMDKTIAKQYSDVSDYPEVAINAIKEMFFQKGSTLKINKNGYAESGILIRHLVIPGHIENSIAVLRKIAEEISTNVHISLMSQYYPTAKVSGHPVLSKTLTSQEYSKVVTEMERLDFFNGWIQELDSSKDYIPDFENIYPFENKTTNTLSND